MAIQDDFTIDYVDRKITYTTAFVDDRPPNIYTVNELYSFLQDTFDEPAQMDDPIPMSAQTPTQYTFLYPWFIDNESVKALYGGSLQTSGWAKTGSTGITALRYQDTPTLAPDDPTDIGVTLTGGTSTATGVILAIDTTRQVVWVRNTSAAQFQNGEAVTGTGVNFNTMAEAGFKSGENVWANLFSVGSKATTTEIYVGQEPDQLGGTAYHDADADSKFERRIEKLDEWWDTDVDFFTGSPNLLGGAGHFDILVLTQEMGSAIDGSRLAVYAREFGRVYSSFELVGGVGNFVVPFASTGADLNSADGPYTVNFNNRTGNDLEIGDVLENNTGTTPVGRLRAVVTAVTGGASATGSFEYYLIGENEPLTTTDRTLKQLANLDNIGVRGDTTDFDINGAPSKVTGGPAEAQGITVTFADAQYDINEDSTDEEYACTIDCNNVALATVYKRMQFLTSRGNQDGTTADTQDTLLPSGNVSLNEAGEFYRAVGDIIFDYDGGAGTQPTEGDLVTNGSGAYGVVTSITAGTTGKCVLTQVKGTFADNDNVYEIDAAGTPTTNRVVVAGTPSSITDNTGAPFGTFAGGRWFVAQGVVLINVPAADANNWESVDLDGNRVVPPTVRTITFAGLVANDRAAIFEVGTAGGDNIVKNQNGVSGTAAVGATTFTLDTTVALDVPPSGWVRVVDTSDAANGTEFRFEYSSVSGTTVTFRTGAGLSGTTTSAGTATVLNDTGAFTNFGTDGNVKIGMEIRNVTDGSRAVVIRKIDNDSIETTPLTGGTGNDWGNTESWAANVVVVALAADDTVYFPFIDDVASGTTLTATIKYVADTDLIARARFSSADIGGQRILPFELRNVTLTDADLTVTAIRTDDTIAS